MPSHSPKEPRSSSKEQRSTPKAPRSAPKAKAAPRPTHSPREYSKPHNRVEVAKPRSNSKSSKVVSLIQRLKGGSHLGSHKAAVAFGERPANGHTPAPIVPAGRGDDSMGHADDIEVVLSEGKRQARDLDARLALESAKCRMMYKKDMHMQLNCIARATRVHKERKSFLKASLKVVLTQKLESMKLADVER